MSNLILNFKNNQQKQIHKTSVYFEMSFENVYNGVALSFIIFNRHGNAIYYLLIKQ